MKKFKDAEVDLVKMRKLLEEVKKNKKENDKLLNAYKNHAEEAIDVLQSFSNFLVERFPEIEAVGLIDNYLIATFASTEEDYLSVKVLVMKKGELLENYQENLNQLICELKDWGLKDSMVFN